MSVRTRWHKRIEPIQHPEEGKFFRENAEFIAQIETWPFFKLDFNKDDPWNDTYNDDYETLQNALGRPPFPFESFVIEVEYFSLTHFIIVSGKGFVYLTMDKQGYMIEFTREDESLSVTDFFIRKLCVLLHTKGMMQEQQPEPKFINKQREKKGKPLIPKNVIVIKPGHYYSRGGVKHVYDERKPVKIHWRRGHVRSVWCGTGEHRHTEQRYIKPCLVNYKGDGDVPSPQLRVVR